MILQDLFSKIPSAEILSKPQTNVSGVATESNYVEPGDLFIPLIGNRSNGYKFINQAIDKGASAVAGDEIKSRKNQIASVYLPNAYQYVPYLSAAVYNHPTRMLKTIGVTGTHGKTTVAYLVENLLKQVHGDQVGYIGSVGYRWAKSFQQAHLATPPVAQLQRFYRKMVDAKIQSVVVECSSHGIHQGRLNHSHFDIALMTNLTPNHLEYHLDFVAYRNAKWKLFSPLLRDSEKEKKTAIFNIDDSTGRSWARERIPGVDIVTYSTNPSTKATVFAQEFRTQKDSIFAKIHYRGEMIDLVLPLIGAHNLQNALAAVAVAHSLRLDHAMVKKALETNLIIPGRLEKVPSTGEVEVFVDFAHTEEALDTVTTALRQQLQGRLITVFGCGGDTDPTKRPKMGKVAASRSEVVVITSDNPREEDPLGIMNDIVKGIDMNHIGSKEIFKIANREEAITHALKIAKKGDIVLIAGKGHEAFQEVGSSKLPFDDRKIVRSWFHK